MEELREKRRVAFRMGLRRRKEVLSRIMRRKGGLRKKRVESIAFRTFP